MNAKLNHQVQSNPNFSGQINTIINHSVRLHLFLWEILEIIILYREKSVKTPKTWLLKCYITYINTALTLQVKWAYGEKSVSMQNFILKIMLISSMLWYYTLNSNLCPIPKDFFKISKAFWDKHKRWILKYVLQKCVGEGEYR